MRQDPDFFLLDGTLAECDRVGNGRADYFHKHRRHGVNVQVVTDPNGRLLWLSPALPGRSRDLAAARARARAHRIIRICERQGVPILADPAYKGGGRDEEQPDHAEPSRRRSASPPTPTGRRPRPPRRAPRSRRQTPA